MGPNKIDYVPSFLIDGNYIYFGIKQVRIGLDIELEAVWKVTGINIGVYGKTEAGRAAIKVFTRQQLVEIISDWLKRNRFEIGLLK